MKTIGFIDYYLDEWHANQYPDWIHQISGGAFRVAYAYGEIDSPLGGRTTQQWCDDLHVERCATIDEVLEKSDYVLVLSPDNPEMHWPLCQKPLRSGKRVYVDKTFAPDAETARALFALAEENHTAMFSSSALRFSNDFMALPQKEAGFVLCSGPGKPENYLIHQVEQVVAVLKARGTAVQCMKTDSTFAYTVQFTGGKLATMHLLGGGAFATTVKYADGEVVQLTQTDDMFQNLIRQILRFYETGESPVPKAETIAIAEIIEAAHQAEKCPETWVKI